MKVVVCAVGRPGALLREAVAEYEARAGRYWSLDVVQVREERSRGPGDEERVRAREAARLRRGIPRGLEVVALTREGSRWTSVTLARRLQERTLRSRPGTAFVLGGAFGLDGGLLAQADVRLSLSSMTLPHDVARLVLAEQLYRAGTILRREPYHKGRDA